MGELTAPDSTSVGLTRLGRDAAGGVEDLGPLAGLVGTWIGSHGWELIAVPTGESGAPESFRLIVRPHVEVIEFSALGAPVPNRGGPAGDMFVTGLLYTIRISDLETNEPLHLENGMWLNLGDVEQPIARQASIPHGDAFLALGSDHHRRAPADPGPQRRARRGSGDAARLHRRVPAARRRIPPGEPQRRAPGRDLQSGHRADDRAVGVHSGGRRHLEHPVRREQRQRHSVRLHLLARDRQRPQTGDQIQQLQYSQQTNIEFLPEFGNPDKLIMWPHVNVNTLLKQ